MVIDRSAIIHVNEKHGYLVVSCYIGHLIEATKLDRNFAGSMTEAEWGARPYRKGPDRWDRLSAKCQGAGHDCTEGK